MKAEGTVGAPTCSFLIDERKHKLFLSSRTVSHLSMPQDSGAPRASSGSPDDAGLQVRDTFPITDALTSAEIRTLYH
jgi:hypothetical protein